MDETGLLEKLVSIPSVFPNESEIGEFLEAQLQSIGFTTRRQEVSEGRFNVLAERGSEGKPILFYGHMDTVPQYGNWDSSPFKLRRDGDKLHGLGAYDMKAGISAILCACGRAKTQRKIKIAFAVDEENNSEGGWAIANSGFASDASCIITPEINDFFPPPQIADTIVLGRRGRAVYEFLVPGESSHGAHPDSGTSAINEACRLIPLLSSAPAVDSGKLPPPTQFVRSIHSESTSLSLPEGATIELDRHLVFPETPESVLGSLQRQIDSLYSSGKFHELGGRRVSVKLKERKTPYLPPFLTPEDSAPVPLIASIVKDTVGSVRFSYGATVCDENVFAPLGMPIIDFGPVGAAYHSANEWVSEKSLRDVSAVFSEFIRRA